MGGKFFRNVNRVRLVLGFMGVSKASKYITIKILILLTKRNSSINLIRIQRNTMLNPSIDFV